MGEVDAEDGELLRSGDPSGLSALFDRYQHRVFHHVSRLLSVREDAKDAVIITFFELWRHRNSVRLVGGSSLPWLLKTATNVARNIERAGRRYRKLLDRVPEPQQPVIHGQDETGVMTALRQLPSGQRNVIVLTVLEGYSDRETAMVLGIPLGTVKSRLSRAKAKLRDDLGALEAS